jgi:hypothetical protein
MGAASTRVGGIRTSGRHTNGFSCPIVHKSPAVIKKALYAHVIAV